MMYGNKHRINTPHELPHEWTVACHAPPRCNPMEKFMTKYDPDFPLQIRDIAGQPSMIIHEPGKIDIIVEVQDGQIPALNALRNLIEEIYGKN